MGKIMNSVLCCNINQAAYFGASKKCQQTEEPQQKSRESSCGSPARGGLCRDAFGIDPNLIALWMKPSTSQTLLPPPSSPPSPPPSTPSVPSPPDLLAPPLPNPGSPLRSDQQESHCDLLKRNGREPNSLLPLTFTALSSPPSLDLSDHYFISFSLSLPPLPASPTPTVTSRRNLCSLSPSLPPLLSHLHPIDSFSQLSVDSATSTLFSSLTSLCPLPIPGTPLCSALQESHCDLLKRNGREPNSLLP
ncbi:UNVERIFIED_CONTAM: hypothetical protein FKN15_043363 [Acipenser sinensis]